MATLAPLIPLPAGSSFNGRVLTVPALDLVHYDYELVLVDVAGTEITPLASTLGLRQDATSVAPAAYSELDLTDTLPLVQAAAVQPWQLYKITGDWNAVGTDSSVYVTGLTARRWASLGWILDAAGNAQNVVVDVVNQYYLQLDFSKYQAAFSPIYLSQPVEQGYQNFDEAFGTGTIYANGIVTLNQNFDSIITNFQFEGFSIRGNGFRIGGGNPSKYLDLRVTRLSDVTIFRNCNIYTPAIFNSTIGAFNKIPAGADVRATDCIITGGILIEVAGTLRLGPGTVGAGFNITGTGKVIDERLSATNAVAVGSGTVLKFTQPATYPVISSGTFTVDVTGAEPGVVVFAELGPGAAQPALGATFELIGSGSHQAGKRLGYTFQVMPSGQIEYQIYLKP
jgi:hypothetical protein